MNQGIFLGYAASGIGWIVATMSFQSFFEHLNPLLQSISILATIALSLYTLYVQKKSQDKDTKPKKKPNTHERR